MFNPPTLESLTAFRNDQDAVRVAVQIKRDLERAAHAINLETLLAVALNRFPDEEPAQALRKLGLEAAADMRDLERIGDAALSLLAAERDRLEPLRRAALNRLWPAVDRLRNIPQIIAIAESSALQKRKELKVLGVEDLATLERAAPMPNYAEFETEKRALEVEIAAIESFIRTGDESVLPPGIEPLVTVRPEVARVEQKSALAQLAEEVAGFLVSPARR
ncbi:MAG: hypothetical protein WA056_01630 [Gallionella sp.]